MPLVRSKNFTNNLPSRPTKHKINAGDWVTPSRSYAKEHGEGNLNNKFKIISKTVPAKHLHTDGNSIHEWGYHPKPDMMKESKDDSPYGFIHPSGKKIVGKPNEFHNDLAKEHGLSYLKSALQAGYVRYRHTGKHHLDVTYNPKSAKATVNAHKYVKANPHHEAFTINDEEHLDHQSAMKHF